MYYHTNRKIQSIEEKNYKPETISSFAKSPISLVQNFNYIPPNYTNPFLLLEKKAVPVLPPDFTTPENQIELAKRFLGFGLFRIFRAIQNRTYVSKQQGLAVSHAVNAYVSYFNMLHKLLNRHQSQHKLGVDTEGWFWSSLQAPVYQCHTIKRVGLHWDSGRFICDPETFYNKHNLVIGIGSNNQYDWEEELIDEFSTNNVSLHISILDCTVQHFRKPKACTNCTTHKLCVGTNDTDTTIRLSSLAKRLYPDIVNPTISLLKIDVEAWEHVVFPDWLQDIMMHDASFSVNQIQIEFHRWGHDSVSGTSPVGQLHAHYWMLHMYALGFLPIAKERNYWGACCYEFAFVNVTWFALDVTG